MANANWQTPINKKKEKNELRDRIRKLALQNVLADFKGESSPAHALRRWWCRRYNRPYHDPLLETYTLEELLIEYYENLYLDDEKERKKAHDELMFDPEEEEAWLKEQMGDDYMSPEEMNEIFNSKKKDK